MGRHCDTPAMSGRGTPHRAIRIPEELWRAALEKAKRRGESVNEVVREALRRYVENDD